MKEENLEISHANIPQVVEIFTDNGQHSHYHTVNPQTGEILWSSNPDETVARGESILPQWFDTDRRNRKNVLKESLLYILAGETKATAIDLRFKCDDPIVRPSEAIAAMIILRDQYDLSSVVAWFAKRMQEKLEQNKHKGGWNEGRCTLQYLSNRLTQERKELYAAIAAGDKDAVIKECADIANFAMMIADRFGKEFNNID